MKHIGLKIIAFICGIALWLYAISLKDYSLTLEVPLVFSRLSENIATVTKPPEFIEIRIEGRAFDLIRLRSSRKKAAYITLDLHTIPLGLQRFEITKDNFVSPSFPNIHYIGTNGLSFIELEFDTKVSHTVPIKLAVEIELDSGFVLMAEPTLKPSELTLRGARKSLMRIFEVQTAKDRLQKLQESDSFSLPLDLKNIPSNIEAVDSVVKLQLEIQPVTRIKIDSIPVQLIGMYNRKNYALEPPIASIEITGGKKILDSLRKKDIELFIEFNRFAIEDTDSLNPTVRTLKPVQSTRINPEKFYLKKINSENASPTQGNTP